MELKANKSEEVVDGFLYFHPDELRTKEFNQFVDRMLTEGTADEEVFSNLTPVQRQVYSVLNRAFARIKRLSDSQDDEFRQHIDSE